MERAAGDVGVSGGFEAVDMGVEIMTESKMQEILYCHLYHKYFVCNYFYGSWEADLLTVTDAGYVKEFEIKLSRADFMAEFKFKLGKHHRLKKKITTISQFWFVIHGFKVSLDEIPEHAGLMEVTKGDYGYYVKIVKKAPKLCKWKICKSDKRELLRAVHARYWNLRIRNRKQAELF